MTTESAQKRPLSSLSTEECQTIFALAFGYAPPNVARRPFTLSGYCKMSIQDGSRTLIVYQDGSLLALKQHETVSFNACKVVGYLASLNIAFGPEQKPRRSLSELSTEEGDALFRAAFNHEPADDIIVSVWDMMSCVTISDGHKLLTLSEQGTATIHRPPFDRLESVMWPSIKPQNLINCLNGLNVQFGNQQTGIGA